MIRFFQAHSTSRSAGTCWCWQPENTSSYWWFSEVVNDHPNYIPICFPWSTKGFSFQKWDVWYKFCPVCYGFVMQCINLSSANQIKSIMICPFFVFFPAMQNVLLFYGWQLYTHHITVYSIHIWYVTICIYLFQFSIF